MNEKTSTEQGDITAQSVRENSVGWMLNALAGSLNLTMKKQLKLLGLTIDQFAIMMNLLEADGCSQTVIGNKINLPGYAITRNLDKLVEQGYIERQPDKSSRRSFCIVVTEQGHALAPSLFQLISEINTDLLSGLTAKEADQLKGLLSKLITEKLYSDS